MSKGLDEWQGEVREKKAPCHAVRPSVIIPQVIHLEGDVQVVFSESVEGPNPIREQIVGAIGPLPFPPFFRGEFFRRARGWPAGGFHLAKFRGV